MTTHARIPRPCRAVSAVEASGKILLDADALARTLSRIAHEIIEANPDLDDVALVGIQTRGVPLAQRLARLIEERAGEAPALGAVDITFYRDDVRVRGGEAPLHAQPVVRETQLDFPLEGRTVVLVDDVLYTGRTIRAAIEALFDYGRPARVQLAVIVDRGHRELPIRPDYVGKNLPTARARAHPGAARRGRRGRPDPARAEPGGGVTMNSIHLVRDDLRPPEPPPRRHLISIADLTRDDVERLLGTAHVFAASLDREREEAADAQGPPRRQPLLRVVDAHLVELRARGEAPLGRHADDQVGRLVGRQGRVAEGHRAHARRLRPRRDRHPASADRRAAARRARRPTRTS